MRFNHAGQRCDATGQVVGLETDGGLLPPSEPALEIEASFDITDGVVTEWAWPGVER